LTSIFNLQNIVKNVSLNEKKVKTLLVHRNNVHFMNCCSDYEVEIEKNKTKDRCQYPASGFQKIQGRESKEDIMKGEAILHE